MANTNGYATTELVLPSDSAVFRIGGKDIAVPALTLGVLERTREQILSLGPSLDLISYARAVIKIIAVSFEDTAPELTEDMLVKFCSAKEMRNLVPSMNALLEISGLGEPSAAGEASPGTGMSTVLPPNSPSGESVEATPGS